MRSAPEAFAARPRLRAALEGEVPLALQRAFDRAAPGDAAVHIPRLELRLRVPNLEALAERLAGALDEALEHALRFQVPKEREQAPGDFLEVLLDYLDTGGLAWHAAQHDPAVAASVLRSTLLEHLAAAAQRGPSSKESLSAAVQFYFRALALLPPEKWPLLAPSPSIPEETLDQDGIASVVAAMLATEPGLEALGAEAFALVRRSPRAAVEALVDLRPEPRHKAQRVAASILACARVPEAAAALHRTAAPARAISKDSLPAPEGLPRRGERPIGRPGSELPPQDVSLPKPPQQPTAQPFALIVGNAGLVLLHPFLPRLLETCALTEKNRLKDPERAAALLHWLSTGREEVHEFELGFVKLLLGLRPESRLAVGEGLVGPREREEGGALLAAAIEHWNALGKSSPDALRVAFLQRRGALREEQAGWRLQPEPEAYDVLLGRLPWGFATVKLPWMTRPLFTDWPTP
ncbi:MAG TPA: contractile injection system tape measure protein [Burkholderiales bacterium]